MLTDPTTRCREQLNLGIDDQVQHNDVSDLLPSRSPAIKTALGELYQADCLEILPELPTDRFDTVFADPPFNLNKFYGYRSADNYPEEDYAAWCQEWIAECIRVLKPGGAFFLYHLPRWNIQFGAFLNQLGMTFRHWIAVEQNGCLPIAGRLYPSHYSLIYYTKGKPSVFRRIRTPVQTCRHCDGEIKDYGGHRKMMNPNGVTLKDIWTDIPPVRHSKFKSHRRGANALSTRILDRVVEMTTLRGQLVLDPFGGSGTTYAVCESRGRHWLGIEIEDVQAVEDRLFGEIEPHPSYDYVEDR